MIYQVKFTVPKIYCITHPQEPESEKKAVLKKNYEEKKTLEVIERFVKPYSEKVTIKM